MVGAPLQGVQALGEQLYVTVCHTASWSQRQVITAVQKYSTAIMSHKNHLLPWALGRTA